jgi:serine-type D-Ala-D-Ala carboxypeptidase (penicillin-binding protein 5/6)
VAESFRRTNESKQNRTIIRVLAVVGSGLALFAALMVTQAAPTGSGKKEEGFQSSAPAAILLDVESDSILYDKNGDQLVAPASLAKLMTLEFLFNEIKQGRVKPDDEYIISENAWRKGGAPSHGSTMFAAIHSRVKVSDLIQGIIVDSANDACMAVAEALAGNEVSFGQMLTQRARAIGLETSTFANSTGYPDPNLRVTAREMAELARHIIQTYPDFYPYFSQRDFTWNNIHQQNRNPLLGMGIGADRRNLGGRPQLGWLGDSGQFPVDCRRHRREIGQRARRRGQEIIGFRLPRLPSAGFVC